MKIAEHSDKIRLDGPDSGINWPGGATSTLFGNVTLRFCEAPGWNPGGVSAQARDSSDDKKRYVTEENILVDYEFEDI